MKRYIIFAGNRYYPRGGWHDYYYSTESFEEAVGIMDGIKDKYEWIHIVDAQTNRMLNRWTNPNAL